MKHVYAIGHTPDGPLKVGYGTDPVRRLISLQIGSPVKLHILGQWTSQNAKAIEGAAHKLLAKRRSNGEWFNANLAEVSEAVHQAILKLLSPPQPRAPRNTTIPKVVPEEPKEPVYIQPDGPRSIGYARPHVDLSLSVQVAAIRASGVADYDMHIDEPSLHENALDNALRDVRAGDTFVVWSLDRVANKSLSAKAIRAELKEKTVTLREVQPKPASLTGRSTASSGRAAPILIQQ